MTLLQSLLAVKQKYNTVISHYNCILKNNFVKKAFYTTFKNFKEQWRAKKELLNAYYIFLWVN